MDIIATATGKELATDYVVAIDNPAFCYIRILNKSFVDCAMIFSNPQETKELTYGDQVLTGYTKLCSVASEGNAIKVQLTREMTV